MGLDDMSYEEIEELKASRARSIECMQQAIQMLEDDNDLRAMLYLQSYLSNPRVRAQNDLLYQCGKIDVCINKTELGDPKYVLAVSKKVLKLLETLPYDVILRVASHQTFITSDYPLAQAALRSDQDDLELTLARGIGD